MYIRFTRILIIIVASAFLGMCINWLVQYKTIGNSVTMLLVSISAMILLIAAVIGLQFWENKKYAKEAKLEEERKQRMQIEKDKLDLAEQRRQIEKQKADIARQAETAETSENNEDNENKLI